MKYLVDANVLSEPTQPQPQAAVVTWLQAHERAIAVDPVILGEIRFGILLLPLILAALAPDAPAKGQRALPREFFDVLIHGLPAPGGGRRAEVSR